MYNNVNREKTENDIIRRETPMTKVTISHVFVVIRKILKLMIVHRVIVHVGYVVWDQS